jgi:predicted ATPase/DNA-binding CsgD family transcriptional regulator
VGESLSVPALLTPFVNRVKEVGGLRRLILEERLVTLVGPGGVGKTRLALKTADAVRKHFPGGLWLMELSALDEPRLLSRTVAQRLGIREDGHTDAESQLVATIGVQHVLMVLDNCEHLVDAIAPLAARLLEACPRLRLLATSRERLGVAGESVWRVDPMDLPLAGRSYATYELEGIGAAALFLERARRSSPGLAVDAPDVALLTELVRKLEGLPLAIELAAAWCSVLSLEDLLARLVDRFHILASRERTMPSRHRSLRAAIDSSYDYMAPEEQWLFRRLGLFVGGWNTESMQATWQLEPRQGLDLLARLVDLSLVTVHGSSARPTRYQMLGSLREYAVDKLREAGELDLASKDFCGYFVQLAETAYRDIYRPVGARWLRTLDAEHDNCVAAMRMALAGDPGVAVRLGAALAPYWDFRGRYTEVRHQLMSAIRAAPEPSSALAGALRGLGLIAWVQGDQRFATAQARRALAVANRLGDAEAAVYALQQLAQIRFAVNDLRTARRRLERAIPIARGLSDRGPLGLCFFRLAVIAMAERRWDEAGDLLSQSIEIGRADDDAERVGAGLMCLARVQLETERFESAEETLRESLAIWRSHASPRHTARALEAMAALAAELRQHERAAWLAGAVTGLLERTGVKVAAPIDEDMHTRIQRSLRLRSAARASAAGRAASLEDAVGYALREEKPAQPARAAGLSTPLTRRQIVVAGLVAQGLTNKEIAARLFISERTAEGHVEQLRIKLGFSTRSQVAAWVAHNLPTGQGGPP